MTTLSSQAQQLLTARFSRSASGRVLLRGHLSGRRRLSSSQATRLEQRLAQLRQERSGPKTSAPKANTGTQHTASTTTGGAVLPKTVKVFDDLDEFNRAANQAEPNTTYQFGNYAWSTDDQARIVHVEGKVKLKKHGRKTTDQVTTTAIGKSADAQPGDVGFHLVGDQFDGPINRLNVVPGNGVSFGELKALNLSAYKSWEKEVAVLAQTHDDLTIRIKAKFNKSNGTTRPDVFEVAYHTGDGKWEKTLLRNQAGG